MPEGVARGPLRQPCFRDSVSGGFLDEGFVDVMAALVLGCGIDPAVV